MGGKKLEDVQNVKRDGCIEIFFVSHRYRSLANI